MMYDYSGLSLFLFLFLGSFFSFAFSFLALLERSASLYAFSRFSHAARQLMHSLRCAELSRTIVGG